VDNVLYSCDFSEKMGPPQPPPGPSKLNPLVNTIREIVDKRRGVRRKMQEAEEEATLSFMTARSGKVNSENMFHIPFSLSVRNAPLKDCWSLHCSYACWLVQGPAYIHTIFCCV
jgi:hypothetical protein